MTTVEPMSAAPTPIPTPPEFPIHWRTPGEAAQFWQQDRMHAPHPITPMSGDLAEHHFTQGFNAGVSAHGLPVTVAVRRYNAYYYMAITPHHGTPAEMEAAGQRAQAGVGAAVANIAQSWDEALPQIKAHLAHFAAFDLAGATTPALVAHLDDTLVRTCELWTIHFKLAMAFLPAMSLFADMYAELFPDAGHLQAFKLLQGQNNKTVEMGRELWQLSRVALASPEVRRCLEERAAADVVPTLARSVAGRAFLTKFNAFLAEYGQRFRGFVELAEPSWIEDPTPAIKNLKDYVAQADRDPDAELARLAAERERLVAEARASLTGYPRPVVEQFEGLLHSAQVATVISEDHGFWIDCRGMYQVRRVLLECGRRLAERGAIANRDDVFMLTFAELRETLASPTLIDRQPAVAERRAELQHFAAITPPPVIGTLPPGAPPDDPMNRAITRFFGGPPTPPSDPNTLHGSGGSAGVVRGTARVIRSLDDAHRLQPGEILIAETTAPPWTPLFASASAVVTDTGGVLSHCAVVAREYCIPAVVGVGLATAMIRDGQTIEVDGTTGTVRLL